MRLPETEPKTFEKAGFFAISDSPGLAPEIFSQGNQLCLDPPLHRVRSGIQNGRKDP